MGINYKNIIIFFKYSNICGAIAPTVHPPLAVAIVDLIKAARLSGLLTMLEKVPVPEFAPPMDNMAFAGGFLA